jgi:hypothetical protein
VTLSEFAFLALGLILGVGSGIAFLLILNARPAAVNEIRLTVAPDALPRRRNSTLSEDAFSDHANAARGGPADRHQNDVDYLYDAPFEATDSRTIVRSPSLPPLPPAGAGDPASSAAAPIPARNGHEPINEESRISSYEDWDAAAWPSPTLGRRATEAGVPVATTVPSAPAGAASAASPAASAASPAAPASAAAPASPASAAASSRPMLQASIVSAWPRRASRPEDLVAVPIITEADPTMAALRESAARTAERLMQHYAAAPTTIDHWEREASSVAVAVAGPDGATTTSRRRGTLVTSPRPGASDDGSVGSGATGCDDLERVADERCEVAHGARRRVETAQTALTEAQRQYDEHTARAEQFATAADERGMRSAKEAAQLTFRGARASAGTRDDVEAAAREWLDEINRINGAARDAAVQLQRERQAAGELLPELERLAVEADVARSAAEAADAACAAARAAADDCHEASDRDAAEREQVVAASPELALAADHLAAMDWDSSSPVAPDAPPPPRFAARTVDVPPAHRAAAIAPLSGDDDSPLEAGAGREPAIVRLVRGDHATLAHLVDRLAGDDPAARRHWQLALASLVDAIVATSIESSILTFPEDHAFWGDFTLGQNRDIAAALASLGFRFDGLGGWADDRVPSQRDLSLAVGYAGLDPMRIRRWPTERETAELYREVRVAADEFLVGAARGLTLGELVTALGRRADALTDVWNDWERVRPLLLDTN